MKKSKREKKARILPIKSKSKTEKIQNVSEVTRSLFSDAWRSYLDQVSMAAVKLDQDVRRESELNTKKKQIKLTIV